MLIHTVSLLIGFSCIYDEKKLDLIVAVDCSTSSEVFLKNLKTQLLYTVNIISNKDFHFRFALVGYQDHHSQTSIVAQGYTFTSDVREMKSCIENLQHQRMGSTKGLADGLALVLELADNADADSDSKCRKDAAKICILLRKYGLSSLYHLYNTVSFLTPP